MKNFSFVKKLPILGSIATLFCIVGILSLALLPFGVNWFNLDVDFAGGTTLEYSIDRDFTKAELDDISKIVAEVTGEPASSVQKIVLGTGEKGVVIKTKALEDNETGLIRTAIQGKYGTVGVISENTVDAVMSADIRDAAVKAALIAVLLMLLYIGIRFNFKSGLAAVIALIHDLLVMLSFYVILQIPLNMNFIVVVLTILGYSINATIVIFDRIRENRKLLRKSTFGDIVDASIRQTFTRSLNTTLTTLFTIVLIIFLGVDSIRNFAIPITIGIIAGLYSSVCLSGPIWSKFMGSNKKNA